MNVLYVKMKTYFADRMRLQGVCCNDAEVVAAAFQGMEKVWTCLVAITNKYIY